MEAKDPSSGASYYYNESTGITQWERPGQTPSIQQLPSLSQLPGDWVESEDETTGMPFTKVIFNFEVIVEMWFQKKR